MYHNEDGSTPWTKGNLGAELFGIALDDDDSPNIYVLPTVAYPNVNSSPQEVWKLDGVTGEKSVFASLPTASGTSSYDKQLGLGQIAYHRGFKKFYVTSFADGKIYCLDKNGIVVNSYDPFNDYVDAPGFVDKTERIWAVQVRYGEDRLYFGTWPNENSYPPGHPSRVDAKVISIALDGATGDFVEGTENDEVVLSQSPFGMPISDIAFSAAGDMLIAERTMNNVVQTGAHLSDVFRFNRDPGALDPLEWVLNPVQYEVGEFGNGLNSAGGVDFSDCPEEDECTPEDYAFFTADAIVFQEGNVLYGMQITPASGGGPGDSYAIDFDRDVALVDKSTYYVIFGSCLQ